MAIAHDATGSSGATSITTSPMQWTHTPVGTPRGALVLLGGGAGTDTITGVTYGGVAMSKVTGVNKNTGETGSADAYFLGSGVPTGAQTVSVTFTGALPHMGASVTVTANGNVAVENFNTLSSDSVANPSITLTTAVETLTYGVLASGQNAPTSISPDANHTDIQEVDFGATSASTIRRSATVVAGSPVVGWTQTADDATAVAVALKELVAASMTRRRAPMQHMMVR